MQRSSIGLKYAPAPLLLTFHVVRSLADLLRPRATGPSIGPISRAHVASQTRISCSFFSRTSNETFLRESLTAFSLSFSLFIFASSNLFRSPWRSYLISGDAANSHGGKTSNQLHVALEYRPVKNDTLLARASRSSDFRGFSIPARGRRPQEGDSFISHEEKIAPKVSR